jgi:hypothetical protein
VAFEELDARRRQSSPSSALASLFVTSWYVIVFELLADPEAAGVIRRAVGRQGVVGADDLVLGPRRQALRTSCGLNPRIEAAGVQPVQVRVHGD